MIQFIFSRCTCTPSPEGRHPRLHESLQSSARAAAGGEPEAAHTDSRRAEELSGNEFQLAGITQPCEHIFPVAGAAAVDPGAVPGPVRDHVGRLPHHAPPHAASALTAVRTRAAFW